MRRIPVIPRYSAGMLIRAVNLVLAVTVVTGTARAADRNNQSHPCKNDVFRLCFLDIPNEKLMTECLESKLDQLSPRCRAVFEDDTPQDTVHPPAQTPAKSAPATPH
ncbi:hypothetical protein [Komagataeibacter saccharivorans]|uniref:hypothetical protein n=1 Tax=Komagataeibacter saccharivorans TaxID=265959 RepID=UPI0021559D47|nr:hypothetical protein [Komagataeibacter saccharivorans]